jgi:hypothetical protein
MDAIWGEIVLKYGGWRVLMNVYCSILVCAYIYAN